MAWPLWDFLHLSYCWLAASLYVFMLFCHIDVYFNMVSFFLRFWLSFDSFSRLTNYSLNAFITAFIKQQNLRTHNQHCHFQQVIHHPGLLSKYHEIIKAKTQTELFNSDSWPKGNTGGGELWEDVKRNENEVYIKTIVWAKRKEKLSIRFDPSIRRYSFCTLAFSGQELQHQNKSFCPSKSNKIIWQTVTTQEWSSACGFLVYMWLRQKFEYISDIWCHYHDKSRFVSCVFSSLYPRNHQIKSPFT